MRGGMHSIHITLRGPSVLLRTRFTTLWRSEIHMDIKIDADALNPRRRRFLTPSYNISIY